MRHMAYLPPPILLGLTDISTAFANALQRSPSLSLAYKSKRMLTNFCRTEVYAGIYAEQTAEL